MFHRKRQGDRKAVTQDQYRFADTLFDDLQCLIDRSHRIAPHAVHVRQFLSDTHGSVPVTICLDHCHDLGLLRDIFPDLSYIVPDIIQIYTCVYTFLM